MAAILFGSIGTLADTSELQRQAFNEAFEAHGLNWQWHREEYLAMLEKSGGQQRIADYAISVGQTVDAEAIHKSKSKIFQKNLIKSQILPRIGVVETIQEAKNRGAKLAFTTTTSPENVSFLIDALSPNIKVSDFDVITNFSSVERSKPYEDVYIFALEKLGEKPENCIAIEDNLDGVKAAKSAGLDCAAFPGENTAHHDFAQAQIVFDRLNFDELQRFLVKSIR
jgi:HAD superfamily hydrolase (TIGR01509 family)